MKKIVIFSLLLLSAVLLFSKDPDRRIVNNKTLIAKDMKVSVWDENGRFNVYAKFNDRWYSLFFDDDPPTGYLQFSRNGKIVDFGSGGKDNKADIAIKGDSVVYEWYNTVMKVVLTYDFIKLGSGNMDTLKLNVTIKNLTDESFSINTLCCFDTFLSEKNVNHFYLPGNIPIASETEFVRDGVPSFVSTASIDTNHKLKLLFDREDSVRPFRIFMANWRKVKASGGIFKVDEGASFDMGPYSLKDSAVFAEYRDAVIESDKSISYNFYIQNEFSATKVAEEREDVLENANVEDNSPAVNQADEFDGMSLSELLALLDSINKKLETGVTVTQQDIDNTDKILRAIEKRKAEKK